MLSIADLLLQHEGKTLEFKRDVSSPDRIMRTLVAFANGAGGILLVGVEDGTRRVIGLPQVDRVEGQIANLISDRIEPRLLPDIHVIPWRKTHLLAVEIFPSPGRPHFVRASGFPAGVYVRVGSTNRQADPAAVAELSRAVLGRSFDEEPMPELNSEALDFRAASECFAPVRKLTRAGLRALHMLATCRRREVPTVGGILLFGKDRLAHFPDAWLRVGCFASTDKSRIVDSANLTGYPALVVDEALHFVRRNTRHGIEVTGARHRILTDFPEVALREAIVNAIVHADYAQRGSPLRLALFQDRIEVENPGNLPPGLTIEDIRRGVSKLRNRVVGRTFHELGLIEQWGSGIQRMTEACRQAGIADPELEEMGSGFRVTFRREQVALPALDPLDLQIVEFVRDAPGAPTRRIAAHIGRTARATQPRLKRLVNLGRLVVVGSGEHDPRRGFHVRAGP